METGVGRMPAPVWFAQGSDGLPERQARVMLTL
jgi:hypothetical protein